VALRTIRGAPLHMDRPLVAALVRDEAAVFASWREQVRRFIAFWTVLALAAAAGLQASQRERSRTQAALDRTLERLRHSEERLSTALDGSGLALFDWDLANDRLYHSAQAAVLRGAPAEPTLSSARDQHHLIHPDDLDTVRGRLRDVLRGEEPVLHVEFRVHRASGGWIWIRARGRVIERSPDGRALRVAGTYADVHERKLAELKLLRMAQYDTLTGLPNRALFHDRLRQALARQSRIGPLALVFVDVDHFKQVNDTLGHDIGDQLLKVFAQRMQDCVRSSDTVSRLAGDEFTVLLEGVTGADEAAGVAAKLVEALREPVVLGGRCVYVTVSAGLAMGREGDTEDGLLRRADEAMYEAKRAGRDRHALLPVLTAEA
jgi:diguanylate cyclase (GGDEF)-like protein/PAS domain S-box-containing protein